MNVRHELMQRKAILGVFGLLIVVALLVILIDSDKGRLADRSEPTESDEVLSEALVMQPVQDEAYTYTFEGIDWVFETQEDGRTSVNFMFDRFSRRDGVYVSFGNPYRLGAYNGECVELESIAYDAEQHPGIPLAFAECSSLGSSQQFMLVQQAEEVVAKARFLYEEIEGDTEPAFNPIYTINLTEVVR